MQASGMVETAEKGFQRVHDDEDGTFAFIHDASEVRTGAFYSTFRKYCAEQLSFRLNLLSFPLNYKSQKELRCCHVNVEPWPLLI